MHVKSDMICFCLFVYFYSCKNNGVRAQGRGEGRGARDCCFWRIVVFFGWEELGAALMVLTAFWKRGWRGLLLYEGAAACFVCVHMCVWETGGQMCWQWLPFIPVLLLLHPARWITEKNAVWGSAAAYVCVCVYMFVAVCAQGRVRLRVYFQSMNVNEMFSSQTAAGNWLQQSNSFRELEHTHTHFNLHTRRHQMWFSSVCPSWKITANCGAYAENVLE